MYKKLIALYIITALLTGCSDSDSSSAMLQADANADSSQISSSTTTTTTTTTATTTTTSQTTTEQVVYTEPHQDLNLDLKQVEVYSKSTVGDLFENKKAIVESPDEIIDTDTLGEKEIVVSYTYNGNKYNHAIKYNVVDTTEPLLLNGGWNISLEQGEAFIISDYVGYADNYDKKPVLTYTGQVDTSVPGSYQIEATVSDSSDNKTTWEITVNILGETSNDDDGGYEPPVDTIERINFSDVVTQYSGDNTSFGIDVSKWQGDIDFEAVKQAGCSFVIMRIGSYYDEYTPDPYFEANLKGAKEAGLKVGVYLYTTANTEEEVIDNANWIKEKLGGEMLDFPVVFDWESFSYFQQYEMSIHDLNSYFELFSDTLEEYGYSAMLYGSKNYLTNFWYSFDDYPIWLAHYTSETDYIGKYDMWQMTCYGRIDGIAGDVDINILYE